MTGHDIARELKRIGIPTWLEVVCSRGMVELYGGESTRPAATLLLRIGTLEEDAGMIRMEHPRAMEATALLLRAYRDARLGEPAGDRP